MKSDVGTAEWLHACWLEEQKADVHVSLVTEWQNVGLYEGFVMAVVQVGIHHRDSAFSIPVSVTNAQIFKLVGKYLDSHPEEWPLSADHVVVKALQAKWPSKKL